MASFLILRMGASEKEMEGSLSLPLSTGLAWDTVESNLLHGKQ